MTLQQIEVECAIIGIDFRKLVAEAQTLPITIEELFRQKRQVALHGSNIPATDLDRLAEAYDRTFEGQMKIIRTELDKIGQAFLKDAKRIFSLIRRC